MRFSFKGLVPVILLFMALLFPCFYVVQGGTISINNPLEGTAGSIPELIYVLITIVFNLSLWIAPLMIIIAGFYFISAGGDIKRVTTAKTIITWTLIGWAISLMALGAVNLIYEIL